MKIDFKKIINIKNKNDLKDFKLDKPIFLENHLFHYLIEFNNLDGLKLYKFPVYIENHNFMNGFHLAANTNNIKILEYLIKTYPEYIYNANREKKMFTYYLQIDRFTDLIKKFPKLDWEYLLYIPQKTTKITTTFEVIVNNLNFKQLNKFLQVFKINSKYIDLLLFSIITNNLLLSKEKIELFDNYNDNEINIKNKFGSGLIISAIYNNDEELFNYLLKRNIDIDYFNLGGDMSPLNFAINKDIINNKKYYSKILLEKIVKTNPKFYLLTNNYLDNYCSKALHYRHIRNQQITELNNIDYSIELDVLNYGNSEAFNNLNSIKKSLLENIIYYDFDIYSKVLIKNKIAVNPKIIQKIEKLNDYDKRWLDLYKTLPKYKEEDNEIIVPNYDYSHSTIYRATFKDIAFYILHLDETYKDLYIPKLISYQLNNLTFENSIPFSDNLIAKEPIFPWTIIYISENEYYIHPYLNNLINAERRKGEKRFAIVCLGSFNYDTWHANILIYDFKNMTVERFEPYGNSCNIDDELDNILEEELTWSSGLKYIRPCDFLPYSGFQSISDESFIGNKKPGDFGGFCLAWTLWYSEMRFKNPDVEPKILVEKLINKINNLDIKFSEYIRNYANKINNKRINYFKKIGIDSKNISNLYQSNEENDKIVGFIIQQMTNH